MEEELLTPEIMEAMGISQPALEEVESIVGRMPTVQELSTLLAMWDANGRQQSLYGWLKGQHHVVERHEYLYNGEDTTHKEVREPLGGKGSISRSENLYMVGNVSTDFLDSEYARRCLHIVAEPMKMTTVEEDIDYLELILGSLLDAGVITSARAVGRGGLFAALVESCRPVGQSPTVGFDVLTCREIRLDAFLFGEERGRYVVSLPEAQDDLFLLKMDEARVNCCFLGHATKGRVLVDDMDWGYVKGFFGT